MSVSRYRPYPGYKDSGIGWMGEIPEHWGPVPLYAKYEIALGKMLDSGRATGEHTVPYLRNVDVQWDSVHVEDLPKMDIPPAERERYRIRSGDLLVCEGGEVGRSAIWKEQLGECYYQKALHRVRPHATDEDPRFLFYVLYSLAKLGVFAASGNQNTIDHLTAVQLRHYRFPHPPLVEQGLIAAFLDRETAKIDALVAKKERLLDLLEEKRAALVTRAVTRGLDRDVPVRESGIRSVGRIPMHWQIKRLWHLTPPGRGIMYGIVLPGPDVETGVPVVKGGDIAAGRLTPRALSRTTFDIEAKYERSRLRGGDLVYSIRGSIGDVGVIPDELTGANLTQDAARVAFTTATDGDWLKHVLSSRAIFAQLDAGATGATIRGINIRDLKRAVIPVPPRQEQSRIAEYLGRELGRYDALTERIQVAIGHLKEYRTALIAAAVTGKIDVREEVA